MDDPIKAARQSGLKRMEGLALVANLDMLRFARRPGFTVSAAPEDPTTTRVVKEL